MDDVVAEVAQQHRGIAAHTEHIAERMLDAGEDVDLLGVGDDPLRRVRGHRHPVRVRHLHQQGLAQFDLRDQVRLAHCMLGRGQQRQREQVDRIDVGGAVDMHLDAFGQVIHRAGQPRGLLVFADRLAVPLRRTLGEHVVERDRLAEVHHHLAVVLLEHLGDRPQQRPDRFLLLRPAGQFVQVAAAFHQLFIADVDRLEQHRLARLAQERAQRHRDHAALGLQQAPGARAAAFDEVLDRVTAGDQLRHVFAEHRRVQRVAADRTADEERTALAQQRADHRQVQVDAGHDVRRHDAAVVQQVGQQQVIHVAAVAGHVDHFVPGRSGLELVQVVDQHAGVDAVPDMAEHEAGRTHHGTGVVRGDFPRVGVGFLPGVGRLGVVALGLRGDRFAHGVRVEHLVHQQAAGRQVRPDHRFTDAAEMGAQHALQLAHGALGVQPLIDRGAQRDRRGEAHDRAAAVEQHRQQATEATHQGPVFGEEHREPAALLVRRAADEDRDRHQVYVQLAAGAVRLQDLGQ